MASKATSNSGRRNNQSSLILPLSHKNGTYIELSELSEPGTPIPDKDPCVSHEKFHSWLYFPNTLWTRTFLITVILETIVAVAIETLIIQLRSNSASRADHFQVDLYQHLRSHSTGWQNWRIITSPIIPRSLHLCSPVWASSILRRIATPEHISIAGPLHLQSRTPDIWHPSSIWSDGYRYKSRKWWRLEFWYTIIISRWAHADSNYIGCSYKHHDICDMEAICGVFMADL